MGIEHEKSHQISSRWGYKERDDNFKDEKNQTSTKTSSVSFYNCLSFKSISHGDLQAENLELAMHKINREREQTNN